MFLQMPVVRRCRANTVFLLPLAGALIFAFPGIGAGHAPAAGEPAFTHLMAPLKPLQDSLYEVGEYNNPKRLPWSYKVFLRRYPQVEKVIWHWEQGPSLKPVRIVLILKSGEQEVYKYSSESEMNRAKRRYGMLPWPAPPVARYDSPPQTPQIKQKPQLR